MLPLLKDLGRGRRSWQFRVPEIMPCPLCLLNFPGASPVDQRAAYPAPWSELSETAPLPCGWMSLPLAVP
ncbi:hypothetical protein DV515_00011858, partial [Chloebia gouldiae]